MRPAQGSPSRQSARGLFADSGARRGGAGGEEAGCAAGTAAAGPAAGAGEEMNPIRVFIADDGTGLALNLTISLARAGKIALCDSAEEAAIIVAETFRFERSIMADVVSIKWLEEAEESGRLPLTKHFSIGKILSGRKIIVLGKSRKSAVASAWASIYFNLIEHLGGRVEIFTDSAEQSQPLRAFCIVQPDDEEFAHPAVEGSSSVPVVSSDWLDACFKANALLPFTNYLLLTSAADKENRKLENTLQQREEGRLQKRIKLTSCIVPPEQSLPELDPSGRLPVRQVQLSAQFSGAERDRLEAVLKTWKLKTADENFPLLVVCKDGTASEMADATTAVRARFFVSEWYLFHVQRSIAALQRKGPSAKVSGSAVLFRNALLAPPKSRFGIKGMHHFVFTSTGFPDDPALRQDIIQSVKVMGALFLPHLATNLTTHLICPDGIDQNPTEKYSKSISTTFASIKIVTLAWLAECLIRWELPLETEFSSQSGQQKDLTPPIMSQRVSEDVDFYAASQVSQFTQLRSASPKKSERKPPVPDFTENQQENDSPLDQEAPKCFLLGSFEGSQQDHAEQIISNLGGILAGKRGDTSFDKDCSHFVVPPDSKRRTEKLLCAIAVSSVHLSRRLPPPPRAPPPSSHRSHIPISLTPSLRRARRFSQQSIWRPAKKPMPSSPRKISSMKTRF